MKPQHTAYTEHKINMISITKDIVNCLKDLKKDFEGNRYVAEAARAYRAGAYPRFL